MNQSRKSLAFPIALAATLILFVVPQLRADLFTPGDLIVTAYGKAGPATSQGAPTVINLIEYSTAGGSPILTNNLPTVNGIGNPANLGVVGQYGSGSEGNIQLSGNGQYLTLAGYSATAAAAGIQASTNTANGTNFAIGTAFSSSTVSLAQSTAANVPRLAVTVDIDGNVNSTTVLNDIFNTNNPRSVYSPTGSNFYISGQGDGNNSDQGIFYGPIGLNTVSSPSTPPTGIYNNQNTRFVTAFSNNLYYSSDTSSGSHTGVFKFTGLPTSSANPTEITPPNNGLSGASEVFYSPDGFYFANSTTLYIADTGQPKAAPTNGATVPDDGGIQKWTFNGSAWSLAYTLTPTSTGWLQPGYPATSTAGQTGFAAITGEIVGSGPSAQVDLFAVSDTLGGSDPNGLYSITDTLNSTTSAGDSFTELESAPGNGGQSFKGVSFAPTSIPEPTTTLLLTVATMLLFQRRRHPL